MAAATVYASCLPNGPEFLYCWFGLALLGAISVPVNTAYKRDETAFILQDAAAKAIVAHQSLAAVAEAAADLSPDITHRLLVAADDDDAEPAPAGGWIDFADALAGARRQPRQSGSFPGGYGDAGLYLRHYRPSKGVQVTHKMYVAAGQGFAHWTAATTEDRFFTCLPFFHANAQYYSTMGTLAAGATLIVAERFSASRFLGPSAQAGATVVNFIGMMIRYWRNSRHAGRPG